MSYYHSRDDSSGLPLGAAIAAIVLIGLLCGFMNQLSVSDARREAGMIYFDDGYCYDAETKIIYREMIVESRYGDSPTYTPYINKDGNFCRYQNGAWIAVDPADAS